MSNILRLTPLFLMLCLIDFAFYQLVWQPLAIGTQGIGQFLFYIFPVVSIGVLIAFKRRSQRAIENPLGRDIQAIVSLTYFSKGFGLLFTAIFGLLVGAFIGLMKLFGVASTSFESASNIVHALGLGTSLLFLIVLIWGMLFNRYRYKVHKVKIPIANLPESLEGFSLVQLSDIHSGSFTKPEYLDGAVSLVNVLNPDLLCFTGDLVNNYANEIEPYIEQFKKIKAKHGAIAILGNHDYGDYVPWNSRDSYVSNLDRLITNHDRLGWKLLRDEVLSIKQGDATIEILGVENISAKGRFKNYGNLQKAVSQSNPSDLTILLSHDPSHWRAEVLDHPTIDLCLSGHTHGMQFGIELGNWLKWSPVKWVYKEWAGLYQQGSQFLYVNRGFGFLGYPGRVGILPEITYIEFHRA